MPLWVEQTGRLLIAVSALLFSLGFLTVVFKTAWVMRGWVEAEKSRANTQEKLVGLVEVFIQTQSKANDEMRQMNDQLCYGLRTLGRRVRDLEEAGLEGQGQ